MRSLMKFKALKKPTTALVDIKQRPDRGLTVLLGPRGMLVDDDCILSQIFVGAQKVGPDP